MFSAATNVPIVEPLLPIFSTREARFHKARDANTLIFDIPTHSSLLLSLLRPVCHVHGQQDTQCLHLLQTVALVPSCKSNKLLTTINEALNVSISPTTKNKLEKKLRPLISKLQDQRDEDQESGTRSLIALQLKEAVADFLRCWIADPIEGVVLRKEYVINGMRLNDLVVTPAGLGYLRGYRREDGFCTIVYPWGQGFVHVKDVEKVQQALEKHLKKRTYNEYVALEHQQLSEQIDKLLGNLTSPLPEDRGGIEEYKEMLESLEEKHVDTTVLYKDIGFLRRVQSLANKATEFHRLHMPQEPEQKLLRTDADQELFSKISLERRMRRAQLEEQQQQEQEEELVEMR
ncbi:unnamed protein product [Peronospora belbahrii]|uniref:Uncharacterized protein n=1 Tax=Peronospora belbahrii TaxID=622444 RepID=A0ABN8CSW7_9STRA|nr:unnamed protein product [Peronospora belbahrii]